MFGKLSVMDDFAWRDVFDFLNPTRRNRKKLVLISAFWDRRFSSVCQKWLHEWTKNVAPLGLVDIISPPPVEPLPEVELPANIHDFTQIQFSYLDTRVLHFLRMMQPLFHDVNLVTYYGERVNTWEETRTTLDHVLPLLTNGIGCAYMTKEPLFYIRDRFPAQFFAIKQIKFRFYHWFTNTELEQLVHWLCTRRADGQQRILRMDYLCEQALTFIERFRQLFLDATSQASFVVFKKMYYSDSEAIQESTTLNAKTNEQLVVRKRRHYPGHHLLTGQPMHLVLVGRCPAELDADEWVEEMSWEFVGRSYWRLPPRTITLSYPTLGQIEDQKAEQEKKKMEGAEEDVDQPGPSQKECKLF